MTKKGNTMAGLTSLPRKKNIKGQPHKLAYITEAESDLLKSMGGAGKPVKGTKGVPAYFDAGEGMGGYGSGDADDATGGMGDPDAGVSGEDQDVAGYDIGIDALSQAQAAAQAEAAAAAAAAASADAAREAAEQQSRQLGLTPDQIAELYTSLLQDPTTFNFTTFEDDPRLSKRRREEQVLRKKQFTLPLLQDPVRMLPKMDRLVDRETATELSKNYMEMLTEAGIEAKAEGKEGLADQIQDELDKGLLADYYQNYDLMNQLEKVGYKTFGTGYRGQYEARTGTNNQSPTIRS